MVEKLKSKTKKGKTFEIDEIDSGLQIVHGLLLNQKVKKKKRRNSELCISRNDLDGSVRMESRFFNPAISLACQTHSFLIHLR